MQFNYRGIFGPDLSHWEGNPNKNQFVDFDVLKASGSAFMITKAGQGSVIDPAFAYNWKASKDRGILRAAYWFLDQYFDGKAQARTFWQLMKADPGEGPLIVDFESGSGGGQRLYDFLVELRNQSNYDAKRIWIYTGYYYWLEHTIDDPTFRQWFAKFPLWLSWYINDPQYVKIPYPWAKATLWQKTDHYDGSLMGTVAAEVDYNEFNGDVTEFAQYFTNAPASDPVAHTQPYAGVDLYQGHINGVRYHVALLDMQGKRLHIHHTPWREALSSVARRMGAVIGVNGDDWDKRLLPPYLTSSLSWSDGQPYQTTQKDGRPYLNIGRDNSLSSGNARVPINPYNLTSYTRLLVKNGQPNPDFAANPTKIEYVEFHARTAHGIHMDGRLMTVVVEGKYTQNTGCTLPQLADLLISYGAQWAGESGGGGDSGMWVTDQIISEPSDPTERLTVQHLLIFLEGGNTMYGVAKEILGNTTTIRAEPSRYGADTGRRIMPNSSTDFVRVVSVVVKGIADNSNDKWLELPNGGGYINYILAGRYYYQIVVEPTVDPSPDDRKAFSFKITGFKEVTGYLEPE